MQRRSLMKHKTCNRCQRTLVLADFYKNKSSKDGYEGQCKDCVRERREKRYAPQIYEIHDLATDKYYIGQTIKPLTERISHHFTRAKKNVEGKNSGLYKSMRANNLDRTKFPIKTLEVVDSKEALDEAEKRYIEQYIDLYGIDNVYNNTTGGHKGYTTPHRQRVFQSRAKGTMGTIVVYDWLSKRWIGEFDTLQEVAERLNITRLIMKSSMDWGIIQHYVYFYGFITNSRFDAIMQLVEKQYKLIRSKNGGTVLRKKHDRAGKNNPACKYSDETIRRVKQMLIAGDKMSYISEETNVPYKYIIEINMKRARNDIKMEDHEDGDCYHRYK